MSKANEFLCPINRSHKLQDRDKLIKHIMRCKEMRPYKTVYICGYHNTHMFISQREREIHHRDCPFRLQKECQQYSLPNTSYDPKAQPYQPSKDIDHYWKKNKERLQIKEELLREQKQLKRRLAYNPDEDLVHLYSRMTGEWGAKDTLVIKTPFMGGRVFELVILDPETKLQTSLYELKQGEFKFEQFTSLSLLKELNELAEFGSDSEKTKIIVCACSIQYPIGDNLTCYLSMLSAMIEEKLIMGVYSKDGAEIVIMPTKILNISLGEFRDLAVVVLNKPNPEVVPLSSAEIDELNLKDQIAKLEDEIIEEERLYQLLYQEQESMSSELIQTEDNIISTANRVQFLEERLAEYLKRCPNPDVIINENIQKKKLIASELNILEKSENEISQHAILSSDHTLEDLRDQFSRQELLKSQIIPQLKDTIEMIEEEMEPLKLEIASLKSELHGMVLTAPPRQLTSKKSSISGSSRSKPSSAQASLKSQYPSSLDSPLASFWPHQSPSSLLLCNFCGVSLQDFASIPCGHVTSCWVCARTREAEGGPGCCEQGKGSKFII